MSKPPFSIRGINVCESLARHSPQQVERLLQRMHEWRMNTLLVLPQYGFRRFESLIRRRCAELGISLVHNVHTSLAFLPGCPNQHFAQDEQGRPHTSELACETRPCPSDPEARRWFRDGARRYFQQQVHDGEQVLLATADGVHNCRCRQCRGLSAIEQWQPMLEIAVDEARRGGRRIKLHFISYVRRFALPRDMSIFQEIDAVLFDTHVRWRWGPLGADHLRSTLEDGESQVDPRAAHLPMNRYLLDRLRDWRSAFAGRLYVFENLMLQATMSLPQPNTGALLHDIETFRDLGIDGVVYEAFEPGMESFAAQLATLSRALCGEAVRHEPGELERACPLEPDLAARAWPYLVTDKFDGLAMLERYMPDPVMLEHARRMRRYLLDRTLHHWQAVTAYAMQHRERLDWLYIPFTLMKWMPLERKPKTSDPLVHRYLATTKLWDFMEEQDDPQQRTEQVLAALLKA